MNATRQTILDAVRDVAHVAPDLITEETYIADLALDSIDYVEIMIALATRFDVAVVPGEMDGVVTLGDLVDYVLTHRRPAAAPSILSGF